MLEELVQKLEDALIALMKDPNEKTLKEFRKIKRKLLREAKAADQMLDAMEVWEVGDEEM